VLPSVYHFNLNFIVQGYVMSHNRMELYVTL